MSLIDKIFGKRRELNDARTWFKTLSAYTPTFTTWGGAIYESETVRSAIDARARHISKLKVEVVGTANPALRARLKLGPNEFQTWSQFLYRVSTILDVANTCFVCPVLDDRASTVGVYPVLPARCEMVDYNGEVWLRYQFSNGQIAAVELARCCIMTKHQYKDDFFGDKNSALKETMQLMHIQTEGIEQAVKNAATFRFMATMDNFASPDDLKKERERFTAANLQADNKGGFLLFPNKYRDVRQIDVKPYTVDAEQMKQIRENVYNYFGVSEAVLQNSAKNEELEAFFDGAIEPFAIQFSEAMTKMLFTERERTQGTYLIANANRLQYMSTSQKVQMAQQLLDRGVMSINEARELFNYSPVDGGDVRPIRGEYKSQEDQAQQEDQDASEE